MSKILESFWRHYDEKREEIDKKIEQDKEHRNWFLKVLINKPVFILHLFAYLSVNGFLIMIWLLSFRITSLAFFWPFHSLFGWGFGLGFHALTYIMYNDKSEILTYIRYQSRYITTYVYHAFFYISVNLYLFLLNLIDLRFIWFTWTLGMWGIFFGYHTLGFFTWNKIFKKQWKKLLPRAKNNNEDFSWLDGLELRTKIKWKIGFFWSLLTNATYFIVVFMLMNVYFMVETDFGEVKRFLIIEIFLNWLLYLGWHTFVYVLFYHVESIKKVVKWLIVHISLFALQAIQFVLDQYGRPVTVPFPIWGVYIVLLWVICIVIHAIIVYKWDNILEKETEKVKIKYSGEKKQEIAKFWSGDTPEEVSLAEASPEIRVELEKEAIQSIASRILIWRWSFITHLFLYIVGLVIIGITLYIEGAIVSFIHPIMGWLIGVAAHGAIYYIVQKPIKGFWNYSAFFHLTIYIITCTYLIILNILFTPSFPWSVIAILGWGVGIGIHLLLMNAAKKPKTEKEETTLSKGILIFKWSFNIHFYIYIICMAIICLIFIVEGNPLLIIYPAMGWFIGISAHWAIYYAIKKPIEGFLKYSAFIHLIIYISVSAFLVVINIIFTPESLWSPIAIGGWGIGIGFHVLLAHLTGNEDKNKNIK